MTQARRKNNHRLLEARDRPARLRLTLPCPPMRMQFAEPVMPNLPSSQRSSMRALTSTTAGSKYSSSCMLVERTSINASRPKLFRTRAQPSSTLVHRTEAKQVSIVWLVSWSQTHHGMSMLQYSTIMFDYCCSYCW